MGIRTWLTDMALAIILSVPTTPASADVVDRPVEIAPFVQDGKYWPGDFAWARGAYDDASPGEKVLYLRIAQWATHCLQAATAQLKTELAAVGYPNAAVETAPVGPLLCLQFANRPLLRERTTVRAFLNASARGVPIADGFLSAVSVAEVIAPPRSAALGDQLQARTLGEQILRNALNWGGGPMKDAPPLSEDERAIVSARISVALAERDHENTEWLKAIIERNGWPKISEVGAGGAKAAWLLVQHADADPMFQLQALKRMEPLVSAGEVSKQDYAYLYDRVYLKLNGRQRYGTQAACYRGVRAPQPLENPSRVDALRKEVGLASEADYLRQLDDSFGPCPAR